MPDLMNVQKLGVKIIVSHHGSKKPAPAGTRENNLGPEAVRIAHGAGEQGRGEFFIFKIQFEEVKRGVDFIKERF